MTTTAWDRPASRQVRVHLLISHAVSIKVIARWAVSWENHTDWPEDEVDHDHVFLGRAMDEVGRAMFPSDWTGREPTVVPRTVKFAPSMRDASPSQVAAVLQFVPRDQLAAASTSSHLGLALSQDQWSAAVAKLTSQRELQSVAPLRFQAVRRRLTAEFSRGTITCFVLRDFDFIKVDPRLWATGSAASRFEALKMSQTDPSSNVAAAPSWIFVDKPSLKETVELVTKETTLARARSKLEGERTAIAAPPVAAETPKAKGLHSAPRRAIRAYADQECGGELPKMSDQKISDAINDWLAEKGEKRQAKYGVQTVSKSTVMRERLNR